MARLPIPGGDDGSWGTILNDFLKVAHNNDGTIITGTAGYNKPTAGIPKGDLATSVQESLFDPAVFPTYQLKFEYDSGTGNPSYVGESVKGVATSSSGWTIANITYDVNNNPTVIQTADGVWDNRAILTYS